MNKWITYKGISKPTGPGWWWFCPNDAIDKEDVDLVKVTYNEDGELHSCIEYLHGTKPGMWMGPVEPPEPYMVFYTRKLKLAIAALKKIVQTAVCKSAECHKCTFVSECAVAVAGSVLREIGE